MKKKLLIVSSVLMLASTMSSKAQKADFDLYFQQYTSTQFNTFKASAKTSAITLGGISIYVPTTGRPNNLVFGTDNSFNRVRWDSDACMMIVESPNALAKMALVYNYAGMKITYGPAAPDTTGLGPVVGPLVIADWRSTLLVKTGATQTATDPVPGVANYFTLNDNPNGETKYVEIQRVGQARLFEIAVSTSNFTTLPLNFISFTAKANATNKTVSLNWKTTNEVNTKEFVIERKSGDGDFVAIGTVASSNSAGVHAYSFADATANGKVYYRIKQVDLNGSTAYSKTIDANIDGSSISVYPNPTSNEINITHAPAVNASLKIFGLQGKSVYSQAITAGADVTKVNVSSLAAGVYYVVLTNNGSKSVSKFVKN